MLNKELLLLAKKVVPQSLVVFAKAGRGNYAVETQITYQDGYKYSSSVACGSSIDVEVEHNGSYIKEVYMNSRYCDSLQITGTGLTSRSGNNDYASFRWVDCSYPVNGTITYVSGADSS